MSNLVIEGIFEVCVEMRQLLRKHNPLTDLDRYRVRLRLARRFLEEYHALPHSSFKYASLYIKYALRVAPQQGNHYRRLRWAQRLLGCHQMSEEYRRTRALSILREVADSIEEQP